MPASIPEGGNPLLGAVAARTRGTATRLSCPSCGSAHVAQVLGDNGGISYVCTSCGHSWS
jgi:transposase-like protein